MKLLLIFLLASLAIVVKANLQVKFSWKQMSYRWKSKEAEEAAIKSKAYIPENNLPLGLDVWKNKMFITVPRWKSGVASSLNYVNLNSSDESPKLIPYPSWEANYISNVKCKPKRNDSIISSFRINVDKCDRLWVLDTGLVDIMGESKQMTGNAIVIFDLKTDKLIRRFTIPGSQIKEASFLANIIVDSDRLDCSNAYAYVPDLGAYGVIVYSLNNDESYRVEHNYFHMDPMQGDFNVGGVNFQWTDGVFAMTVGPKKEDGSKDIYFHALASTKEFKVSNRVLQDKDFVTSNSSYSHFAYVGNRGKHGQSTAEIYDENTDVIFYTEVNKNAISCWNIKKDYTVKNQGHLARNANTLQFPNDLKIDENGNIWVLSDKMPTFLYKKLDPAAVNYRVLTGNTKQLIKDTKCQLKSERHSYHYY